MLDLEALDLSTSDSNPLPISREITPRSYKVSFIANLVAIVYKIKYKPGYRSCDLLNNLSALMGGKFIFQKKSFTRYALPSEYCNFNQ